MSLSYCHCGTFFNQITHGSGSQTVGRDPQWGREGLEREAQHTFLQIKIKTALNQLEK
jgi:hypothetical protein